LEVFFFFAVVVVVFVANAVVFVAPQASPKRSASTSLETVLTGFLGDVSDLTVWSCAK
jgi:hypothetical protein